MIIRASEYVEKETKKVSQVRCRQVVGKSTENERRLVIHVLLAIGL